MDDERLEAHQAAAKDLTGTQEYHIYDFVLASALIAVGVPQVRPAKVIEFRNGHRRPVFCFAPYDAEKVVSTSKAMIAASDPLKFIAQNPLSPLSFALAGIMQYASIGRQLNTARPIVPMSVTGKAGGAVVYLTKDSRKYQAALRRGMKPIEVKVEPSALQNLLTQETQQQQPNESA